MSDTNPGQPGAGPKQPGIGTLVALGIFLLLLVLTIVLVVGSIPAGFYAVFGGRLSNLFDYTSLGRPYFWIGPVVEFSPVAVSLGLWFAGITALYSLMLVYAARQTVGPVRAMAASFREGFSALASSPFVVTLIAIGFLSFTASVIDAAVSSSGVPIGNVVGDPLQLLMGFTTSPLVEELGFRVLLIGVVALILSIGRPWRDLLGALWRPSRAVEGLAVGGGGSLIIWAATAFSAVTFGACHVLCGSGTWDIGKFPEAAYGGLVLGVLYVKYGLHVAVLVHWGIDYFGSAYAFFGQVAYGIPWASGTNEFIGQYLVDIDMLLLFGVASFLLVVYWLLKKALTGRAQEQGVGFDKGAEAGGPVLP